MAINWSLPISNSMWWTWLPSHRKCRNSHFPPADAGLVIHLCKSRAVATEMEFGIPRARWAANILGNPATAMSALMSDSVPGGASGMEPATQSPASSRNVRLSAASPATLPAAASKKQITEVSKPRLFRSVDAAPFSSIQPGSSFTTINALRQGSCQRMMSRASRTWLTQASKPPMQRYFITR